MMDPIQHLGKFLLILGVITAIAGALLLFSRHIDMPFFGRLPGDIVIRKKNFTFYFPVATSILLSILLTIILYFLGGGRR